MKVSAYQMKYMMFRMMCLLRGIQRGEIEPPYDGAIRSVISMMWDMMGGTMNIKRLDHDSSLSRASADHYRENPIPVREVPPELAYEWAMDELRKPYEEALEMQQMEHEAEFERIREEMARTAEEAAEYADGAIDTYLEGW